MVAAAVGVGVGLHSGWIAGVAAALAAYVQVPRPSSEPEPEPAPDIVIVVVAVPCCVLGAPCGMGQCAVQALSHEDNGTPE
jgi:hypothetical protein